MSRTGKLVRNSAVGLGALIVVVAIAVLLVARTGWFREYVKQRIIVATEEGTGGKVEIGSFDFDEPHLTAVVNDLVIHGDEPAGSAPFVRVRRATLVFRLFISGRLFDITSLGIDQPQANVIILANGRTNIPTPKKKSASSDSALKTVVDLAVGHFELTNGLITLESRTQPLSVRGDHFRAQLLYDEGNRSYRGQLSIKPLYVAAGRNTPVNFEITLPVTLQEDRIEVRNAAISTPLSTIAISGSLENLRNPTVSVRIGGHLATTDLARVANIPLAGNAPNLPANINLSVNATASNDRIDIARFQAELGQSKIQASGLLRDPAENGSLEFRSSLSLGELGALLRINGRPEGELVLNGRGRLERNGAWSATGRLQGTRLAVPTGTRRIANVELYSDIAADQDRVDLTGLRVEALGGEFEGSAALVDFERFELGGVLKHLGIQAALRELGENLPYDGAVSGSIGASGDTKTRGMRGLTAQARLTIAPARRGTPISGQLNADYNGAADDFGIKNSYLALPHTRIELNGSLSKRLNVALTTSDLSDLLAAAHLSGPAQVGLNRGQASFNGTVTGSLGSPRFTGQLSANHLLVEGRPFDSLIADVAASRSGMAIRKAELSRAAMRAEFAASVGLRDWKPLAFEPISADLSLTGADLADLVALAWEAPAGYSGGVSATGHIQGTVGNPQGAARLDASSGTIAGEPFDRAELRVNLTDQLLTIPVADIQSGSARIDFNGEFRHPRDSFTTGTLKAALQTNRIDLGNIRPVQNRKVAAGVLQMNATVTGSVSSGKDIEFLLTSANADISARNLRFDGESFGDLDGTARTNAQTVAYDLKSDFAGSNIHINGNTRLAPDYPTTAAASISNLPIERALERIMNIPARGNLSGTANFSGTVSNPRAGADLDLTRAVLYNEPIDRAHLRATWLPQSIDVEQLEAAAGPSRIALSAHYDHPSGDLRRGSARFDVESSRIDLARIHYIQILRPGLGGDLRISAQGAGIVEQSATPILLTALNANIAASGVTAEGKNLGDVNLTAKSTGRDQLDFALDSDLAGASIHGKGEARLSGAYPVNAQVNFHNVAYTRLRDLLGPAAGKTQDFEALADGETSISGAITAPTQLHGDLQLARLNFTTIPRRRNEKPVTIGNQGPIVMTLDKGAIAIQSAHLTGPQTDIRAAGAASLVTKTMDLTLDGQTDLGVLPNFDRDINSSGSLTLAAAVKGTTSAPLVNGQLTLRNASLYYTGVANGLSNANGVIAFNGNSASIRNLTAESGGGKIAFTGAVAYSSGVRFGLRASGTNVRIQIQEGVSVVANASIQLSGTEQESLVSGDATIERVTYNARTDIGSLLARAAPPVQSPQASLSLLQNMKLDIRVRTSSSFAVQASMAENLQADANLQIRGTAAEPGATGRITISDGQLVFFGSTYKVSTGTIAFYNPLRIAPVLDISLETETQGVDVVVRVTGPADNLKLSYTSNPPLQFQQVVSLLAAGKTPTTDPTLLANQPLQAQQSFQQMGESAILGQALANPVAGQLQRVFGVTQLNIDPTFQPGVSTPTARLTLQQRISGNITFTYTTAVDDPNGEIINVEWTFDPKWSAVATRDQNGIFSINFFYRRQFR